MYKREFVVGTAAGILSLTASLALRGYGIGIFLPELGAQAVFSKTPGFIESLVVGLLGGLAKHSVTLGLTAVVALVYGAAYEYSVRWVGRGLGLAKLALAPFVAYQLVSAPLALLLSLVTEVSAQPLSLSSGLIGLLASGLVYSSSGLALMVVAGHEPLAGVKPTSKNRRSFISLFSALALSTAFFLTTYSLRVRQPSKQAPGKPPRAAPAPVGNPLLESEVTPSELFYTVDINIIPPKIDASEWRLRVHGLVEREVVLTYDDLRRMFEPVEEYATLECVSNKIGGDLISNAKWRGVRLRDVIKLAGVKKGARYVVFRCEDGYDVGVPLERALSEKAMLAYEMNGHALPLEHGYPVRAIIPGLYGMMNPKWVTSIEIVDYEHRGFWQRRGWTNKAEYKTHSFIVTPGDAPVRKRFRGLGRSDRVVALGSEVLITGIAFAGDRGVSRVEVSVDGGRTWSEAELKPPLSDLSWVIWSYSWRPRRTGRYVIAVRAYDGRGVLQETVDKRPFPDGATGIHKVTIDVV